VRQDVDEVAEWVADIEAPDAPGLIGDGVDDAQAERHGAAVEGVDVIDLDRDDRHGCAGAALAGDADFGPSVRVRSEGQDPALVHDQIQLQEVLIEFPRCRRVGSGEIRNDAANGHDRLLPQ
jgi:hypothetical protein